jgi:hypothetical protein
MIPTVGFAASRDDEWMIPPGFFRLCLNLDIPARIVLLRFEFGAWNCCCRTGT